METQKNLPQKKFRAGAISVTIWDNPIMKDGVSTSYKTVSIERCYKDKNNAWQSTNSFHVQDLPKAALAIGKAYEHIVFAEKDHQ